MHRARSMRLIVLGIVGAIVDARRQVWTHEDYHAQPPRRDGSSSRLGGRDRSSRSRGAGSRSAPRSRRRRRDRRHAARSAGAYYTTDVVLRLPRWRRGRRLAPRAWRPSRRQAFAVLSRSGSSPLRALGDPEPSEDGSGTSSSLAVVFGCASAARLRAQEQARGRAEERHGPRRGGGELARLGGAEPDHARAARRARALRQRDDGAGERRAPAADAGAGARAGGAAHGRGDRAAGARRDAAAGRDHAHRGGDRRARAAAGPRHAAGARRAGAPVGAAGRAEGGGGPGQAAGRASTSPPTGSCRRL